MELENANPLVENNVLIKCFHFFQKYWKLSQIKDFKVYFRVEIPYLPIN